MREEESINCRINRVIDNRVAKLKEARSHYMGSGKEKDKLSAKLNELRHVLKLLEKEFSND